MPRLSQCRCYNRGVCPFCKEEDRLQWEAIGPEPGEEAEFLPVPAPGSGSGPLPLLITEDGQFVPDTPDPYGVRPDKHGAAA